MRRSLGSLVFAAAILWGGAALAQSSPNWVTGFVPTAAQWNTLWASKQNTVVLPPNTVAGSLTGGYITSIQLPSTCTGSGNALTFTGSAFGCNTGIASGNVTGSSLTAGAMIVGAGSSAIQASADISTYEGTLFLGGSGTAGAVTMGNATSGTLTLQPASGALGSAVISFPAVTDTSATLAATQTLTNKTIAYGSNTLTGVASSGANSNITSLSGLTTPLSVPQGGTGADTITGLVLGNGASAMTAYTGTSSAGNVLTALSASGAGSFQPYGLTGNSTLVETTSGGLLTASLLPAATTSTLGAVIVGTGLSVTSGTVTPTFGTASGDVAEGGVITAAGPIGSATVAPIITYNAAGQLTTVSFATITPAIGSVTGLGTGVATALGDAVNGSGGLVTYSGALGTPTSGTATNLTGTASGLTAGAATNLAGGSANEVPYQTGSGATAFATELANAVLCTNGSDLPAFCTTLPSGLSATNLTLTTPILGTPQSGTLTNATGLPISGVTGWGTGVATILGNTATGSGSLVAATSPSISNPTVTGSLTATGLVTLGDIATQATNTVLVNATSGSASPTAQSVSSCSAAGDALNWTTNTGFGCNASITAAAAPISGLTGAGTGVLTALGNAINGSGGLAPVGSPSFTGTVTLPDTSSTITSSLWTIADQVEHTAARTIASGASATLDNLDMAGETTTVTGTTNITTSTGFNLATFYQPTFTDSSSATITNAATLAIVNAPTCTGSLTCTNKYALWVQAGATDLAGATTVGGALTYGGVTLSNAVTGTGDMVLASSPSLTTPALGVATATSVAIGGATIGSNGLAVTGTGFLSGTLEAGTGQTDAAEIEGSGSGAIYTSTGGYTELTAANNFVYLNGGMCGGCTTVETGGIATTTGLSNNLTSAIGIEVSGGLGYLFTYGASTSTYMPVIIQQFTSNAGANHLDMVFDANGYPYLPSIPAVASVGASSIVCVDLSSSPTADGLSTASSVAGCAASDPRLKNKQPDLVPAISLAKLMELHPGPFTYKSEFSPDRDTHVGLYADEVCEMDENLCIHRPDGWLNYDKVGIAAYTISALQGLAQSDDAHFAAQQAQIDDLRATIEGM